MKLLIGGDVCPANVNDLFEIGDAEVLFGDVIKAFHAADRVLINFECAMTESKDKIKKIGPNLKATPKCAKVLKEIGVTDVALSNNHIFDYGVCGVKDTLQLLEKYDINYTGFGKNYENSRKNLIIPAGNKTVSIINVCEHEYCYALDDRMGARPFDPFDTIEDIRTAKEESDFVIVLYHGGKEHCEYPSPRLIKTCRSMIKNGADVVLCQHSHCIGGYEKWNGGHILYGQGNFYFCNHPSKTSVQWNTGLLVQLDINDEIKIDFLPVESVTNSSGIRFATGEIKEEIMGRFAELSKSLADGTYHKGWHDFCEKQLGYRRCIENADGGDMDIFAEKYTHNERFAHYLHCEAHQDVWRELYRLPWEMRDLD
ncbi:MAG: CapA family protein [Lachnospiraceae bacterium]|nr:CapA family protein [Lachnospiraceae bacterium]